MSNANRRGRCIAGALLLGAWAALWIAPSDVARLVVEQDQVLLGRYSENRFFANLVLTVPLVALGVMLSRGVRFDRTLRRRLALVLAGGFLGFLLADLAVRWQRTARYEQKAVAAVRKWPHDFEKGTLRTRPPNESYPDLVYVDRAPGGRSYPDAPKGYPKVKCPLTVDARGFRNPPGRERADIVTLGDSFTEGSRVGDTQAWPRLLEERLGRPVYNLGVSGASPRQALNNLLAHADTLRPSVAVCLLYQGNDFKVHAVDREQGAARSLYESVQDAVKDSAVVKTLRKQLVDTFEKVNADAPVRGWEPYSWMPLAIETGAGTTYYAFKPSRLMRLDVSREKFAASKGWRVTAEVLDDLKQACALANVRPIVVFAPSTPRVVLPLARERIPAEGLHRFASIEDDDLPPPERFAERLFERLPAQEETVAAWCRANDVQFVDLTPVLQRSLREGKQVYYTYDQHWTPDGHAVVAPIIAEAVAPLLGPS